MKLEELNMETFQKLVIKNTKKKNKTYINIYKKIHMHNNYNYIIFIIIKKKNRILKAKIKNLTNSKLKLININSKIVTRKYTERDPTDEILKAFKLFDEDN